MDGWIKMHRKILENPIFKNAELYQLFSYCLLSANHKDGKAFYGSQEIEVKKGQFVTGRFTLSKDLNQNESGLYKRLKRLESLTMIRLESNNRNTLVTIVNWDLYQDDRCESNKEVTTDGQQNNNKVTTKEQQSNNKVTQTRMKECKNERMKENKVEKTVYAEFVTMTPEQYLKLVEKHGEEETKEMITILDNYKGAKDVKYASDYHAILKWVVGRLSEEKLKKSKQIDRPVNPYREGY